MIQLIQFPWSPFCIVQRRILQFAGAPFLLVNIPNGDRSLVWRLTRERYYQVPVLKDGKQVIFETDDDSQVLAKYLDQKFNLGLFPREWSGLQHILWRHIENEVEGVAFKLNDVYWKEFVARSDQCRFVRHKERKFGRGCLEQWAAQRAQLLVALERRLLPFDQMLATRPFLLDEHPRFVDFDLYGMLGNFLYSGHYELPRAHGRLRDWHAHMAKVKLASTATTK